jgi:adenosylhomocysteine nucleosidase
MKKNLLWMLPLLGTVLVVIGATQQLNMCDTRVTTMPLNVVVTAFEDEQNAVLSRVELDYSCVVGNVTYHIAQYEGERLITYMSGVGQDAATRTTTQTLESFNVTMLVFAGIAGAVDPSLTVGDTVVVKTWHHLGGGEPIMIADTYLQRAAQENVVMVEDGVSVDYFVTDTSTLPSNVSIVDMETYDIATVANEKGVPFIAFRSVSDRADGSENSEDFKIAASNSADAALAFIAHN